MKQIQDLKMENEAFKEYLTLCVMDLVKDMALEESYKRIYIKNNG